MISALIVVGVVSAVGISLGRLLLHILLTYEPKDSDR